MEAQRKLASDVDGDFFRLLGILSYSGTRKQVDKSSTTLVENAKVIFEETSSREFDFNIKSKVEPKQPEKRDSLSAKF